MQIRIKKLNDKAKLPTRGSAEAAGYDLYAVSKEFPEVYNDLDGNTYRDQSKVVYGTGLAVQLPKGYVGLLFPRSSVHKTTLSLANSVGVLDSDYTGEVKLMYRNDCSKKTEQYAVNDRIGQLVVVKHEELEFEEVKELSKTDRGEGGFGSTGA